MSRRKKPWDHSRRGRRSTTRQRQRYLIVTEDAKSSLLYVTAFPIDKELVELVTAGGSGNTVSVVSKAIDLVAEGKHRKEPYVHAYAVFDRDNHPHDRYERAFDLARHNNDLTAIWANECFELWYLHHYQYRDTAIGREAIYTYLTRMLGKDYDKGDDSIYTVLLPKMNQALSRAQKLEDWHAAQIRPHYENPSTNVYYLIRRLQELSDIS